MTNQQHWLTPPHDKVYWWWEEACKRPPSSFYEKLDYVAAKAAEFGWQERDASVPGELQQARDEELQACCEWVEREIGHGREWGAELRRHRRPQPKSLAEEALLAIDTAVADDRLSPAVAHAVRRALERLQELEGQGQLTKESD